MFQEQTSGTRRRTRPTRRRRSRRGPWSSKPSRRGFLDAPSLLPRLPRFPPRVARGPPLHPARSAPSARPPRAAKAPRWPPSRGPGAPKPPRTPPPSGARARPGAPTHLRHLRSRRKRLHPHPRLRLLSDAPPTPGTRRARHRPPRRRPRSQRRPSRAPRPPPRTPRGRALHRAHPRKRPRGRAERWCRPRRRRRSLRGVRVGVVRE